MRHFKQMLALVLALVLALGALSALAENRVLWADSCIIGAVTPDTPTDPKDDIYLYANKDWFLSTPVSESTGMAANINLVVDLVRDQVLALLEGEPLTSHEGQLVQIYYQTQLNMDKRNELGLTPIMPEVERIQAISTMEELKALLTDSERLGADFLGVQVTADTKDSSRNAVYLDVGTRLFADADEYRNLTNVGKRSLEASQLVMMTMLKRLGYDETAAQGIMDSALALDREIGEVRLGASAAYAEDFYEKTYNPMTIEEISALTGDYPVAEALIQYTEAGAEHFIVSDTAWLVKLGELYKPERLEDIKNFLLTGLLRTSYFMLDEEALELSRQAASINRGMEVKLDMREDAYQTCAGMLPMAVGHMYTDAYVTDKMRSDVTGFIHQVVEVYRGRLEKATWLGEETRAKALEKLDNLIIRAVAPTDWSTYDYSALTFVPCEEGGNLISQTIALMKFRQEKALAKIKQPIDHSIWDEALSPQTVNAFYNPSDNSINIIAGLLNSVYYDENASYEENLASVALIIGHEITHAFDSQGSQFDYKGNLNNWWTDADRAAFKERTQKVADYYGSIEVLPGMVQNGQLTIGEAVADLGGMSVALEMAKSVPNFDYQRFFIHHSKLWAMKMTQAIEEARIQDIHPTAVLRTNCLIQQFDEFYEAFGVQEGDGMYLAPEERLHVW